MEKSKKVILCVALAIIAMVIVFSANVAVTYATDTTQEWFDLWHLVDWTPVKNAIFNSGYGLQALNIDLDAIIDNVDEIEPMLKSTVYGLATIKNEIIVIDGLVDAIKAKTDTIVWTDVTAIDSVVDAIKLKTDTIVWTDVTAIDTVVDAINARLTDDRASHLDAVSQVTEFDGSAATSASAVTSLTGTVGTDGKAIKVSVVVDTDPIKGAAAATSYVDVSVMIDGTNWRLLVHQDVHDLVVYTTDFTAEKFKVEINRGADGLGAQTIYFSYVYETAP